MNMRSREAVLRELETLDVLVMGGGVNGAGILRDLALRAQVSGKPLRVGMADRGHFSSGTSGRNSQLIHGGLRYLKNLEFKLVREALSERATLLRTAPHLVEPLAFLIPMRNLFSAVFYGAGLFLYDLLAGRNRIERHRHLSTDALKRLEPRLGRFFSGARFFDCRVHSARLVLLNIRDAVSRGAFAANYVSVESVRKQEDGSWNVELLDRLSGRAFASHAREIVDSTGAWSSGSQLRLVRGSHLILPRIGESENAISYFGQDGRIIFFIPWGRRHGCTLIGTTDVDHTTGPDQIRISPEEVSYLLRVVEEVFPNTGPHEPICAYSSLRPLIRDQASSATKTSREHRIWADERGMVHVSGGKYTTYRLMSEGASDLAWPALADVHRTAVTPLLGNTPDKVRERLAGAAEMANKLDVEEADVRDLIKDYGDDASSVLDSLPLDAPAGLTRLEAAQIQFAVEQEFVERLTDLMFVSTYWGYEQRWTAASLEPFASETGRRLGWDREREREEIERMLVMSDQPSAPAR